VRLVKTIVRYLPEWGWHEGLDREEKKKGKELGLMGKRTVQRWWKTARQKKIEKKSARLWMVRSGGEGRKTNLSRKNNRSMIDENAGHLGDFRRPCQGRR